MPATPLPGQRLILVSDNLFDFFGTRTDDGATLSYEWGEPDENGWYTPVLTRTEPDIDLENEVLFLTSHERIYDAFQRMYPSDPSYATELCRHFIRRLTIPSREDR